MRNVRKLYIFIFVLTFIWDTVTQPAGNFNENPLRWRRHNKNSASVSESDKKQKQQEQPEESEALTRSKSARTPSYTINTPTNFATIQANVEPVGNVLQGRQAPFPFNYQEYLTQLFNNPAYQNNLYELQNNINNLNPQQQFTQFWEGLSAFPNGIYSNLVGLGTGLQQLGQFVPQFLPPVFGNNLYNPGQLPNQQPNLSARVRGFTEQHANPITPQVFPGAYAGELIQPAQLRQMIASNPPLGMVQFGPPPQYVFNK